MARMGHDSERAAMIYQHEARGADQAITSAIDSHVRTEQGGDESDDGEASTLAPAGLWHERSTTVQQRETGHTRIRALTRKNVPGAGDENRTRTISLGIPPIHAVRTADQPRPSTVSTRGWLLVTLANCTLIAR